MRSWWYRKGKQVGGVCGGVSREIIGGGVVREIGGGAGSEIGGWGLEGQSENRQKTEKQKVFIRLFTKLGVHLFAPV